jgi:hypothetical protein
MKDKDNSPYELEEALKLTKGKAADELDFSSSGLTFILGLLLTRRCFSIVTDVTPKSLDLNHGTKAATPLGHSHSF